MKPSCVLAQMHICISRDFISVQVVDVRCGAATIGGGGSGMLQAAAAAVVVTRRPDGLRLGPNKFGTLLSTKNGRR